MICYFVDYVEVAHLNEFLAPFNDIALFVVFHVEVARLLSNVALGLVGLKHNMA